MPEQQSRRGNQITASGFESPFETKAIRLGVGGLNLKDELDVIPETQASRLTDIDHDANGAITARPGQTSFATAGVEHHSERLLRQPRANDETRFWGIDSFLYRRENGPLTQIDAGYSGDPLTLVPHRPPLSGDPWMFVADRNKMRKARSDNLVMPIGLPAPGAAPTAALAERYLTVIATCDTPDNTQANAWIPWPGHDPQGNLSGIPTVSDFAGPEAGNCIYIVTQPGNLNSDTLHQQGKDSFYDCWASHSFTPGVRDLTQLAPEGGVGGLIPAADEDLIHVWFKCSHPHLLAELRLYFICGPNFNAQKLPGTDESVVGANDAYVKTIRQNDFAQYIQATQDNIVSAETARIHALRDADQEARAIEDQRASWATQREAFDPGRTISEQAGAGSHQWVEFGSIGIPLRRGDFQRIGNSTLSSWANIVGVMVYIKMIVKPADNVASIGVGVDQIYLTGGFGPDTSEPGAQQYDWKATHYDPRTGAESNGSPEMASANFKDALRRHLTVTPAAYGDGNIRQRLYRRGGSLIDDWYFLGTNASDGGVWTDILSDDAIVAAGTIPIDHFQAVPTVDNNGTTVLAQALPSLWGPLEGMLFGCGDPYRPGHLYYSIPDEPDHWSASGNVEVCPASEELMAGGVLGHQGFVFSRQRLYLIYPSLTSAGSVSTAPTLCKRGIKSRWAFCVGPGGIYFAVEGEGVFQTAGGPEQWISRDVDPIFQGLSKNGYAPIDWGAFKVIRLTTWENKLYLLYQDTGGLRQVLVYHILEKFWRHYHFARALSLVQGEDEVDLLLGGLNQGTTYTHTGLSDDGLAITPVYRSGAHSGGIRAEKLFGDQVLDADRNGITVTVQNFLNEEAITNPPTTLVEGIGRQRYILDVFGDNPQKAHSISTEISWSTPLTSPVCYQYGYAITLQPDVTNHRVTNWDDLGHPDEKWLSGVTFDVDTGGVDRTILIERDFGGIRSLVTALTVNSANRHKLTFSWDSLPAHMVRVRPNDDCKFWLLYRADWIWTPEPPRIAKWDIHFENAWDQYYTGLDLYCDTNNLEKRIEVYVDNTLLQSPYTGLSYFPVIANGRRVVHLTFLAGRGHVFRFRAIDDNPGLLYSHRWHLQEEPSEQANWNQNFSIYGTRADKWLKAIIFECDTFNANKQVQVEVDGAVVETLNVRADGRRVVQLALTNQQLGRVWRMYPVDGNPGRLYTAQPIFDEEPFQLPRWETQELNYGMAGWFFPTYAHIVLKSTAPVVIALHRQYNQRGSTKIEEYTIPATGGQKIRHYQTFKAGRDVMHKWLFTSAQPFWLYRDETVVMIQPWGAENPRAVQPFGNDDSDPTRTMTSSVFAAQASGGAADEGGAVR